ncbi:MazG-like nucleotide pyrophosphohydrolase family protein [Agrobacterium vitis]|nr:MazG-like nucleotide pyrophosphohydrolase family protein [Agrobacterium vitis]
MTSNLDAFNSLTFRNLAAAHAARQAEWCPDQMPDLSFRGNELAGEVGEACNIIKKLERERLGWRGSRATFEQLADELADVIHTTTLVAYTAHIDLEQAVIRKFNATSDANELTTKLTQMPTSESWGKASEVIEKIVKQVGNPNSGKTAVISSIDAHMLISMIFRLKTALFDKTEQIAELQSQASATAKIMAACDWYWPSDDTSSEAAARSPGGIAENLELEPGEVLEYSRGGVVETRYYAFLPPAPDADSDDNFEVDTATETEAETMIAAELERRKGLEAQP